MFAQYSPLFTSGLLSDSPSTSRTPSPTHRPAHKPNHDSLPLTVNTSRSTLYGGVESARSPEDDHKTFFLTFRPHRRQVDEGRSFLSLDLAESQSMRSMSLRRKDTVSTRATTSFGKSEPSSPHTSPLPCSKRFPFAPQLPPISVSPPSSPRPTLHRPSRETLRLPSPKPVPSTSLPCPPVSAPAHVSETQFQPPPRRHRPSNLVLSLSDCFTEAGLSSSSSSPFASSPSMHRPSYSAPSVLEPPLRSSPILSPSNERSYFFFSPTSPKDENPFTSFTSTSAPPASNEFEKLSFPSPPLMPPSPSARSSFRPANLKATPSFRSTATVNTRQRNRSAALAALEGRGSPNHPAHHSTHFIAKSNGQHVTKPRNFMSMSDDEDSDEEDDEEVSEMIRGVQSELLWVLGEEEDVVIPSSPSSPSSTKRLSGTASKRTSLIRGRTEAEKEKRESLSARTNSSTPSSKRSRRSTIESFFSPLANFIDLRDDSFASNGAESFSSRSWRSFVEISS